jgi:hypothetical protein
MYAYRHLYTPRHARTTHACRHDRAEKEKEELHAMLAHIMSLTNVAFFGLAGASLKLVGDWVISWCSSCTMLKDGQAVNSRGVLQEKGRRGGSSFASAW